MGGRVAYFFVDAMRFEMGVELARQLEGTKDLTIRPAIAALPTITPVGMAALLPGASASFSVVERKGKLGASIEGTAMSDLSERLKFLKAKVPDVIDIALGKLLSSSPAKLCKSIRDASLVVVRSQEIDALGGKCRRTHRPCSYGRRHWQRPPALSASSRRPASRTSL